jgi:hypothetical protein
MFINSSSDGFRPASLSEHGVLVLKNHESTTSSTVEVEFGSVGSFLW